MEEAQMVELQRRAVDDRETNSEKDNVPQTNQSGRSIKHYKWWIRISIYIIFIIVGQSAATLLGRFYYDKGDNMMYSYGLLYLPVSTYSLLCASQLAFNAVFSFFLNSQKFTPLILNSLILLTISAALLAVNADSENTSSNISKGKYAIGFLCTVGASATYSLYLSLVQLSFEKVIKKETFSSILNMQIYPSFVATCGCVVGLFASGEWKILSREMKGFQAGKISYLMSLIWIAITWQITSIGLLGLVSEVSSLFSNVISTLSLPVIPILAVIFFHDKMDGIKAISMLLAIWGFLSYIYQHYLDDSESKAKKANSNEASIALTEV
ncbi:hypothetical protein COLO4_17121 [Corchorus olitorius]|uniref:Probable purine permease n=1 Tax=Corchorus olitorius TaxID=93759 RepID=A0A1R3JE33_9ROSI|nr:hypothetical protein COLO4_17121 [Corchorus olitorius]